MRIKLKPPVLIALILIPLLIVGGAAFYLLVLPKLQGRVQDTVSTAIDDLSSAVSETAKQSAGPRPQYYDNAFHGDIISFGTYNYQLAGDVDNSVGSYAESKSLEVTYRLTDGSIGNARLQAQAPGDFATLVAGYMSGDAALQNAIAGTGQNYEALYYSYAGTDIPILHNTTGGDWYSLVLTDSEAIVITSSEPVTLTDGVASKNYRKFSEVAHGDYTFSSYQQKAIENTRGESGWVPSQQSDDDFDQEDTTASSYTSHDDLVKLVKQYDHNKLQTDGSIEGTDIVLKSISDNSFDILSSSQLPELTINDLKVGNYQINYKTPQDGVRTFMGLDANYPNSIDVTNAGTEDREFAMLVLFVSDANKVLDFALIDNIDSPLTPNETRTFNMTIPEAKNNGVLQYVQFLVL